MKIPTLLKPEQNLDEKTEQLVKEANLVSEEPIDELDEIIECFDNPDYAPLFMKYNLDSRIEEFVKKSDYKLLRKEERRIYWHKPHNPGQTRLLIRSENRFERRFYAFKIIDEGKLETFLKEFEKYEKDKIRTFDHRSHVTTFKGVVGFMATGLTAAWLSSFTQLGGNATSIIFPISGCFGYMLGAIGLDVYLDKRYKKKRKEFYNNMVTDNKMALREAFR